LIGNRPRRTAVVRFSRYWFARTATPWIASVALALIALSPGTGVAADIAIGPPMGAELSAADIVAYQEIFALQEAGNLAAADVLIDGIYNPILMGHVQFQRYMHPTAYRSKFSELSHWLEHYRDLPGADRIYNLAKRRKPSSAAAPLAPTRPHTNGASNLGGGANRVETARIPTYRSPMARSSSDARKVRDAFSHVRRHLRVLDVEHALGDLANGVSINTRMDDTERDLIAAIIVTGLFQTGQDARALELANGIADSTLRYAPKVDWIAGLAAWNLGEYGQALARFERYAVAEGLDSGEKSAAAFWAARASLAARQPQAVIPWLQRAALAPHSLYGTLATRQLGLSADLDWDPAPVTDEEVLILQGVTAIRRAIALSQIGNDYMADKEIRAVYAAAGFGISRPLLAVITNYGMAASELRVSRDVLTFSGEAFSRSLYPVPNWDHSFELDLALVLAFVRQESAFNTRAYSVDGAHGLMQLMPSTASFVTGDNSLRGRNSDKLFEPEYNLSLGQQYLQLLMETEHVGSNLVLMMAAYNGGPGNVGKWLRAGGAATDPLIFIEKIPLWETRDFVQRVLTNLWMYRARLGQDSPTLDAIASGAAPLYQSVDGIQQTAFRDGRN
jgi:soluble lytic murein transglycosylase